MNSNNIDACVAKYIKANKDKFKVGTEAQKEFDEVKSTLNVDNAFIFEVKEIEGIPAYYMYSSKSKTLLQVYFAIKAEAGHIELSVKELTEKYKSDDKEDNTMMNETIAILSRAKALIEACDVECLEDVKECLKDVTDKIDDCIDSCEKDAKKKDDDELEEKTKEVVNETIERLYEKAALCESIEEASPYIQKAKELQAAIDDIAEEIPIKDDEYPVKDATGGPGQDVDLEEIKDLIGDDKDTIDLLTKDDNSLIISY